MVTPAHYDRDLEAELAGALAAWWHQGPPPDPEHFYDTQLGRIARAFTEHRGRIRYAGTKVIGAGHADVWLIYDGLVEVLTELGDRDPEGTAALAGELAARAPVTHPGDVALLADLYATRTRLVDLETERTALLEREANRRPH